MKFTNDIYSLILHKGIRNYKFKNSVNELAAAEEDTRGSVFGFRTKEDMTKAKGVIFTSIEAVEENNDQLTHWTPNVYRFGAYVDKNRKITRGHSEDNLRQINTFIVDFDIHSDAEAITQSDILTASIDLGFMPTVILKSARGYQAYYVLEAPAYVTSKSNFKVLKIAKEISSNLRNHLSQTLPVDLTCNHFGIARMPRLDNVVFYHAAYVYSFNEWIQWSMKQSEFQLSSKRSNLTVISGSKGAKQIDEPWYDMLLKGSNIKGDKALMGRNNVIFTLALANYSSGVSQSDSEVVLTQFNDRLAEPLSQDELSKIVKSAYSDKYEAASRDYVLLLCKAWVDKSLTKKDLFIRQGWTKFKKKRADRKHSHLHEWESDVLAYLESSDFADSPTLQTTKQKLRDTLSIPERSFDKALKNLKAKRKIFLSIKSGRGGGIRLASIKAIFTNLIQLNKAQKEAYMSYLSLFFEDTPGKLINNITEAVRGVIPKEKLRLLKVDTG